MERKDVFTNSAVCRCRIHRPACLDDNGIGIDPRYRQRIFGVFERLSPPDNPASTGIGLALVKRSVEKMGGTVGVESTPDAGSRFWFTLTAAPRQPSAPVHELADHEQV